MSKFVVYSSNQMFDNHPERKGYSARSAKDIEEFINKMQKAHPDLDFVQWVKFDELSSPYFIFKAKENDNG